MNSKEFYKINNRVIFAPEENLLSTINGDFKPITLHTPTSHCLRLLVQHNNEVLSQKFFFEEVWEKNGILVTANTLYQNIALIRKALKALGMDEEIIKTIPKQGIKISAEISQEEYPERVIGIATTSQSEDNFGKNPLIDADNIKDIGSVAAPTASTFPTDEEIKLQKLARMLINLKKSWFICYALPLLICLASLSSLYPTYQMHRGQGEKFFANFSPVGEVDNCQLYSSYEGAEVSKAKFRQIAKSSLLSCKKGDIAYLSFNRQYGQNSIVYCDLPVYNASNHCKTIVFQEATLNEH